MIHPSKVSAVIVTKGGSDLTAILDSLPFDDIVVWDNSTEPVDRKVYGRYLGIERAKNDLIYVQDDDCIVKVAGLLVEHQDGEIICNVKPGHQEAYKSWGITLVGHGGLFNRNLADFSPYFAKFPCDELFERECDRVFTYLNDFRQLNLGVTDLPSATGEDRMWKEHRHGVDLAEIRARLATL